MSPEALVTALLRRWYILVLAMLLTAAGSYRVLRPAPHYQSSAMLVVKPPPTKTQPNQLTNLQPALAAVSYAVVQQLESPAGRKELRSAGVHGTYRLTPRNSGTSATPHYSIPTLEIQAELNDPEEADRVVQRIITVYIRHLRDLQTAQQVPAASRLSVDLLNRPGTVELPVNRSRAMAGVAAVGTLSGVTAALWADRYAVRRRRRLVVDPGAAEATPPG